MPFAVLILADYIPARPKNRPFSSLIPSKCGAHGNLFLYNFDSLLESQCTLSELLDSHSAVIDIILCFFLNISVYSSTKLLIIIIILQIIINLKLLELISFVEFCILRIHYIIQEHISVCFDWQTH